MTPTDGEEFTELVDASIPRVDLVDKAANGMRFLIAKQQDGGQGLFDPAYVRELLAKSDPSPRHEETVTMTGSPAAIAKIIHGAAVRAADQTTDPVAKDTPAATPPGDLDPSIVLAEPSDEAPGDPNVPGSPAWEAIDAATAMKWTAILARAQRALGVLAERELLEPACGNPDDYDSVMDLGDAACAVEYAISLLAPFAVAEQAEALTSDDASAAVGKALAGWDPAPLETIEALTGVVKAGRVLSTANEAAIRGAVDSLQKVLASLPQAPPALDDGQPVTKENPMPDTTAAAVEAASTTVAPELAAGLAKEAETPAQPSPAVTPDEPVEKAKTPQVAIYDKNGNLVGIVDPGDIITIADADPAPAAEEPSEAAPEEPAAPEDPDLTPAPPEEVGTPADAVDDDGVAKSDTPDTTPTDPMLKRSDVMTVVKAAIDEHSAGQSEALAQQGQQIADLAKSVETLAGLVKALEEQPAAPKVFTQGAVPPVHALRGQDRGAPVSAAVAQGQELKKSLYTAPDAAAQNKIAQDMQSLAIAQLAAIHSGTTG
ncbi:hypothetical protein ABZ883_05025 [Streptomyces sp. NPDC046977]|uniref:hypothetical protein n=1 Tax=Streptomyces sp. NPDC046977 TaxID=3154703 RepID=UPI003407CDFF